MRRSGLRAARVANLSLPRLRDHALRPCYTVSERGPRVAVLYIDRKPGAPLDRFVRSLWYARAPRIAHTRERVLPTGQVQVILNLARDYLFDCREGQPNQRVSPALVAGGRSVYEIIDSTDMADLIGIVFAPSGFSAFVGDAVDLFSNRSCALDAVWGSEADALREQLREIPGAEARLKHLEEFLRRRFAAQLMNPSTLSSRSPACLDTTPTITPTATRMRVATAP